MSIEIEEVYRIAVEAQRRSAEAKVVAEEALALSRENKKEVEKTSERLAAIEVRMDKLEGKMDTLLDSTAQLKNMLECNTDITESARDYSKLVGLIMFFGACAFKVFDILRFAL